MANIPGTICGGGSKDTYVHKNQIAVRFHGPLAAKVTIHAFDNDQETFPDIDDAVSTDNECFGLSGGEESMIGCVDFTGGTNWIVGGTNWLPSTTSANTATLNLLEGYESYVTQHGDTIDSATGGTLYCGFQLRIPASTAVSDEIKFDIAFKYSYTSTVPAPSIFFNSKTGGGTEASPVWASLIANTSGLYFSASGLAAPPYLANIPLTGQEKTQDIWAAYE